MVYRCGNSTVSLVGPAVFFVGAIMYLIAMRLRRALALRGRGAERRDPGTMEKELRQIRSAVYRRAQEVRGKADAEATKV
jgi:membrane protease subunit HflC